MSKKLSIIVPVYNVEKYVKDCLDSLVNQSSNEYEIIVVNDGSTDSSLEICNQFSKNKKVRIFTKKNGGLSSARNYGIDKAKGEYIAFVDSDDWVIDNYVEEIENIIDSNKECDLITYDIISINDGWKDGVVRKVYQDFDSMDKHKIMQECLNPSFSWARVYKKELIEKIKFPTENYWYEDMATTPIVLSKSKNMVYIEKPLYYYRQRQTSITNSVLNEKTLGAMTAWDNSLKKIEKEYIDDYAFALYRSLISFMYFKPEYANNFIDYYNKHKKLFMNNKLVKDIIEKGEYEDLSKKKIIPKKLHYCWFGNGEKGELFEKCLESWKKYAPDFEIIEWNEKNCDINECQYVKEAYENKKWAFVSDYFRIKVLKEHGGIYVDTDVEFTTYIHKLLLNESFFAFETNIVNAAIFGCIPNAPIINDLYNTYIDDKFVLEDGSLKTTYPIPKRLTDVLQEKTSINLNGMTQKLENDIMIYSADILTLNVYNNKNIAQHHYEATWWDAKAGILSYKYTVLEYYFHNIDTAGLKGSIKQNVRQKFRNIIPLSIRKKIKKIIKRK